MYRPLLLLLLCVVIVSRAAHHSFEKLTDVLAATPLLTLHAPSHVACSTRCSRMTYDECTAYSFAENGTCWLFPVVCLRTEPSGDHPGVISYQKPLQPTRWCPTDNTLALSHKCYTHRVSETPLTWHAAQEACRTVDACSYLATPPNKYHYLGLWQFHRPDALEWIGAEDLNGDGTVKNLDGSGSWTPPLVSLVSAGPILMLDGHRHEVYRTTPVHNNVHGYICEYELLCRVGTACPNGWILIDTYCYPAHH